VYAEIRRPSLSNNLRDLFLRLHASELETAVRRHLASAGLGGVLFW
jgi:hypothetical protein